MEKPDLTTYKSSVQQKIQWGEMDAFQHVNNVQYFKYLESGRIHFMDDSGLMKTMSESNIGPILAKIDCNFLKPMFYPDTIIIHLKVSRIGNTSFGIHQVIESENQGIVAQGSSVVVMFDYKNKEAVYIDDELRGILKQYT